MSENPLRRITRALTVNTTPPLSTPLSATLSDRRDEDEETYNLSPVSKISSRETTEPIPEESNPSATPESENSISVVSDHIRAGSPSDSLNSSNYLNNLPINLFDFEDVAQLDTMPTAVDLATVPKLNERMDWFVWYPSIQTYAESLDVWQYMDDKGTEGAIRVSPPVAPVNPTQAGAQEMYRNQIANFTLWNGIRTKISQVRTRIESTINPQFYYIIETQPEARECLKRLREALAPEDRDQVQYIRDVFNELCKGPPAGKNKEEEWVLKWTKLTQRATALNIENMGEQQLCIAFIDACRVSNPAFYQ